MGLLETNMPFPSALQSTVTKLFQFCTVISRVDTSESESSRIRLSVALHSSHPTNQQRIKAAADSATAQGGVVADTRVEMWPLSVSRFSLLRSALSSAADRERTSRSFSSALWIISSSLSQYARLDLFPWPARGSCKPSFLPRCQDWSDDPLV